VAVESILVGPLAPAGALESNPDGTGPGLPISSSIRRLVFRTTPSQERVLAFGPHWGPALAVQILAHDHVDHVRRD
jgi:hypothetical protein